MEHRFKQEQSGELSAEARLGQEQAGRRDFESAEELLRADRAQVQTPGGLPGRIAASGKSEGLPGNGPRPWWRRLFGG